MLTTKAVDPVEQSVDEQLDMNTVIWSLDLCAIDELPLMN